MSPLSAHDRFVMVDIKHAVREIDDVLLYHKGVSYRDRSGSLMRQGAQMEVRRLLPLPSLRSDVMDNLVYCIHIISASWEITKYMWVRYKAFRGVRTWESIETKRIITRTSNKFMQVA